MGSVDAVTAGIVAIVGESLRQLLFASAARARARRTAGATIYTVTRAGRVLFAAAALIFSSLIAEILVNGDDWRVTLLLAPFLLLCVFALPGRIQVDAAGVGMRRWFTPATRIPWHEVIDVRGPDPLGRVIVRGARGQQIVHTGLHAGADEFYRDVMRFARVAPRIVPV